MGQYGQNVAGANDFGESVGTVLDAWRANENSSRSAYVYSVSVLASEEQN
jgi:hypothetical protein